MKFEKYIPQGIISSLADRPNISAGDLKGKFDEAEKNLGTFINARLGDIEKEFEKANVAFKHCGALNVEELPLLTTEDAGNGYYIIRGGECGYTTSPCSCTVENHELSRFLYISPYPKKIDEIYMRNLGGTTLFAVGNSSTDEVITHKVFPGEGYLTVSIPTLSDKNFEEGQEIEVYGEITLTVDDGDYVVWDGYSWVNISGHEALKEHKADYNNPHQVDAGQIPVDVKNEEYSEGTVGSLLREHEGKIEGLAQANEELSANKIKNDSDPDSPSGTVGLKLFELEKGLTEANKKIDNYHNEVNDTAVFEYMGSIDPNRNMPSLTIDDDGKVYNISEDAAHIPNYIRAPKAGTILDYSTHTILELSDAGKKAVGGLEVGDKIDLYDDDTGEGFFNVTVLYIDYGEVWFDAYIESDDSRNGMLVTLECAKYIDLKAGDNIVWTGYSWDNLSGSFEVTTTDEVAEGNNLPVTSDGVFKTVGDINKALEEIIAIQNRLMGVSE